MQTFTDAPVLPRPVTERTQHSATKRLTGKTLVLFALLGVCAWIGVFGFLFSTPIAHLSAARGLYPQETGPDQQPFHWTSSRVHIPINGRSAATLVDLRMAAESWLDRPPAYATLATNAGPLGSFPVAAERRHYRLLLSGSTTTLSLQTNLAYTPDNSRWVGVQMLDLEATPVGPPLRAMVIALLAALAGLCLLPAAYLAVVRGYGLLLLIVLLALGLRLAWLRDLPPGINQDELVSMVDAWYLVHSGHDHHGALLPLGAFEAFGDWTSPLLTYLELPAVALLGPADPLAGRLITALLGTLAVALIYGLARSLELPRVAALGCALVTAVSPWQVAMSRFASPPALVFPCLTLCLWAAVHFVKTADNSPRTSESGSRSLFCSFCSFPALWLALAAGVGLHAYPALKLYLPLLVGVAFALALLRVSRPFTWHRAAQATRGWLIPAVLLALLWLPFVLVTLFNRHSATRLNQLAISANSLGEWLRLWWQNYSLYLRPDFYYSSGGGMAHHGYLHTGVQLWIEAPLVALGLVALLRFWILGFGSRSAKGTRPAWLLITAALLLAPLPTSLTTDNPHAYRATPNGPLYVLLVGLGIAMCRRWIVPERAVVWRRRLGGIGAALYAGAILWQAGGWFTSYARNYPAVVAQPWRYQDGLLETMGYTSEQADQFDEIWIAREIGKTPYIYLLAALPQPLSRPQTQITVAPGWAGFNEVTAVGRYRFVPLATIPIPAYLPAREVVLNQLGRPAYLAQEWQHDEKRVLVVRAYDDVREGFTK